MTYDLVTGDTGSTLRVTCFDGDTGNPINLTGATVRLNIVGATPGKLMTIISALDGTVEYKFLADEIAGSFMSMEVEITDSQGSILTCLDPITLDVRTQLG
jgi:hypothetical protein